MVYKKVRDALVVQLSGELDHHCAEKVREDLDALLSDVEIKRMVFDMKGLTFMDSSGIGVIIGRYKTLKRRNGSLAVTNLNAHMDRIFKISGLYQIVDKIG